MAEDIAPVLLEAIRRDFERNLGGRERTTQLLELIRSGAGTYQHANEYAQLVGEALADAFRANLSGAVLPDGRMYWNIADRVIRPLLEEDHALVAEAAQQVQQHLNEAAELGLKAQTVPLDQDRVNGILNRLTSEPYADVAWILSEPVITFSRAVVDESIRRNVEFQGKAGLRPKIIRKAVGHCCAWCNRLAGTYTYPDVPKDVYRRHENCRCVVQYDPVDESKRRQDVHTRQWTFPEEDVKITERRLIGLRVNDVTIRKITVHVHERMTERSVLVDSIEDAINNPLQVKPIKYDAQGRPSFTVIGRKATVSINPQTGVMTTVYPTHTKLLKKLLEERKKKNEN